jgi:hypothetical protein
MKSIVMNNTSRTTNSGKKTEIRPYTITQLADLYGMERRAFKKWLAAHKKTIGKRIGHLYTIKQVHIIFEVLGMPGDFIESV